MRSIYSLPKMFLYSPALMHVKVAMLSILWSALLLKLNIRLMRRMETPRELDKRSGGA